MSKRCPRCESPDPARHPAMQFEGEVQICEHPWHGIPIDTSTKRLGAQARAAEEGK